ncbi:hypothetical protein Syun_006298 [Stephania yunnanensis]|uniref:Uncharacterized protein n=1 Tax=Stephania yunnanensis TaxID=152371 RepID=A0AAP0KWB1_9MAGN
MDYLISSLRRLSIHGWPSLKSLPEQLQHLCGLEFIEIYDFDGIVDVPDQWFGKLISLEYFVIKYKSSPH